MLATFQLDEFAQYSVLMRMTAGGDSLLETVKNFLFYDRFYYDHYYYGYPFYLASAISTLSLKAASGIAAYNADSTTAYLAVLRQLSPLFMMLAITILIYMWTGFRSLWKSIFLFLFLAAIPAVFRNNLWWHPESLVTLFVVLTIFSLYRDDLEFGKWFYLASLFCGLATATKMIGVWFFLTIAVYLALGFRRQGLGPMLKHAIFFILIFVLTIVVTNPLLLVPESARSIVAVQMRQSNLNHFGWGVQMTKGPLDWYAETLREGFGYWWVYAIALGSCILGIWFGGDKKLLNIIILTWCIPFSLYLLFFVATKYERYFLPLLLPMISCIGNLLLWNAGLRRPRQGVISAVTFVLLLFLGIQLIFYAENNRGSYLHTLHREQESQSLAFYRRLEETYFEQLPPGEALTVFRDPYIYVPPLHNVDVRMKWGSTDYGDIDGLNPDLILLENKRITRYSDPAIVGVSFDQEQAQESLEFYRDAKNNTIKDYRIILETPFGIAFAKSR